MFREIYPKLSAGEPGLLGAVLARAEAHVLRLSLLYAALDRAPAVTPAHLVAALGPLGLRRGLGSRHLCRAQRNRRPGPACHRPPDSRPADPDGDLRPIPPQQARPADRGAPTLGRGGGPDSKGSRTLSRRPLWSPGHHLGGGAMSERGSFVNSFNSSWSKGRVSYLDLAKQIHARQSAPVERYSCPADSALADELDELTKKPPRAADPTAALTGRLRAPHRAHRGGSRRPFGRPGRGAGARPSHLPADRRSGAPLG